MKDKVSLPDFSVAQKLGLTEDEFQKIIEILGRVPNFTELSIFSVMWSEHCSYKNSIKYLKTLPRDGGKLLVGAGEENAGLVDIGDGWACAFKIESHNHPSAIEPYQGAATGVGGIHRDIFTMGARPIAALNSLRFGDIDRPHTKHLIKGVVKGIGDYGNCLGVPTVGGEVYFRDCYNQNILVNAMSVGVVKVGETMSAVADGPGNPVFIVGSATGKDGIHGATFASADLTEDSAKDLPAVQVGDPFQEKLLLEASLEAYTTGAVIGMQDMGAAGITCSTSEMSAKSGTGMRIDLDKVPTRQSNMLPFEILLSESQERMLIVCKKGEEDKLLKVFDKWDLECELIGEVTDTGRLEFISEGEVVADVPAEPLVLGGGAPVYDRPYEEAKYYSQLIDYTESQITEPEDYIAAAEKLMSSPNLASKKWIYEQYDHTVRVNTMKTNRHADSATIRVKGTDKALAMNVDCNSTFVYADPYVGSMIAVAESARNIVCTGGKPVAITNCLNFGNPYNKEVYWQFVNAIKGMGEACRKFNTPVTGGNVSFYNQTVLPDSVEPIYPTPTIGMLGILDDVNDFLTLSFQKPGDIIVLIGENKFDLNSSEYLQWNHKISNSKAPSFSLDQEYRVQQCIIKANEDKLLESAHDISEGGLLNNLLESCHENELGVDIHRNQDIRLDSFLFGEAQSRIVVSIDKNNLQALKNICQSNSVELVELGKVTDTNIQIDNIDFGNVGKWKTLYNEVIEQKLD
ncbi:phosphoribosylformylglycinamidine synthase subunit PurL [Membranihabitans marinus]|uniref:phosphoribosylformylglycinamidine synthase subunit PurL n=1 Tax=Membranihabitans marinus TaxID=1227546 RepID=UPI001F00596D|nr:phosphoribosylformylglycinamidine synthase subunit PurL [Membranihabitans marinus]